MTNTLKINNYYKYQGETVRFIGYEANGDELTFEFQSADHCVIKLTTYATKEAEAEAVAKKPLWLQQQIAQGIRKFPNIDEIAGNIVTNKKDIVEFHKSLDRFSKSVSNFYNANPQLNHN
jgi:hypothetical protein